jgi:NADH dehydrogenase FAD-containing subunit
MESQVNQKQRQGTSGRVVIYGGGVGGAQLAKRLSGKAEVVLVDPLDYFEVPMAAPRIMVQPDFAERAIMSFAEALPAVKHVRAKLVELRTDSGLIETQDGKQSLISGDIAVLATGSRFASELVRGIEGSGSSRKAFYVRFHDRLRSAQRVLIVGGGPIGVEIAGEISETWPDRAITVLEAGPRLLSGTSEKAALYAAEVLTKRGVTIITGDRLEGHQHNPGEIFAPGGEARTAAGRQISYDLLLWCVGGRPATGYLQAHLGHTLNDKGQVRVTPDLRVVGQEGLFALGDITDLIENKMAWIASGHAGVVAGNILALLSGDHAKLKSYKAKTGNPMMAVTLGRHHGVSQLPSPIGVVRASWFNRKIKADQMMVPMVRKAFGL